MTLASLVGHRLALVLFLGLMTVSGLCPSRAQAQEAGRVRAEVRIASNVGGLRIPFADRSPSFGSAIERIGDLDGDGVADMAYGIPLANAGGIYRGAIEVAFLDAAGRVDHEQRIDSLQGGFVGPLSPSAQFGSAIAGLGDLDGDGVPDIAIGAPGDTGGQQSGAIWILFLNGDGTVKSEARIVSPDPTSSRFGTSLCRLGDLNGDGIVDLAAGTRNAVWILFLGSDGTLQHSQEIRNARGGLTGQVDFQDRFGAALASPAELDESNVGLLAVGAPLDDDGGLNRGAVWMLRLNPDGTVASEHKLSSGSGGLGTGELLDGDWFGSGLSFPGDIDGDGVLDLVVGASRDDDGGVLDPPISNLGALRILFLDSQATVSALQKISVTEGGFGYELIREAYFGTALETTGDVNGDGVPDLVVGAPGEVTAFILHLNADGTVAFQDELAPLFRGFGSAIAPLGDLDGDGIGDCVVGSPRSRTGGVLRILYLTSKGAVRSQQRIDSLFGGFEGALDRDDRFGSEIANLGDLNGDGLPELVVGSPARAGEEQVLWILFLNRDGTVQDQTRLASGAGGLPDGLLIERSSGFGLLGPGDLDGDGIRDLVVGTPLDSDGGLQAGAIWLLYLNRDGTVRDFIKYSNDRELEQFGTGLAVLNGPYADGSVDLAIGAPGYGADIANGAAVWIVRLGPDGSVARLGQVSPPREGEDVFVPDRFGWSIAQPGDLNGDGFADLIVGAPSDDSTHGGFGAIWVVFLDAQYEVLGQQRITRQRGGLEALALGGSDFFGGAVAVPGDLDGDGIQELMVGASGNDNDAFRSTGAVWTLFLERGAARRRVVVPRAWR